jgi:xanthine dehydrogenase FAD-binding subunit
MFDLESVYEAKSVSDAIKVLTDDKNAIIIAGGTDVLIKIREGKFAGKSLVSIHEIKELKGVKILDDGTIVIGPTTTFSEITYNPIIQKHIPVLGAATDTAGGPQLRNCGTIGGNICNGATSADSASTLFALDAILVVEGPNGTKEIKMPDFYKGPGWVVLEHNEVLTAIKIKRESYDGYFGKYIKYGMRNAMEIATMGCSVNVKLNDDKNKLEDARIAFGVAGPVPMRCHKTEAVLKGKNISDEIYDLAAKTVLTEVNPRTSWRATKEFRIQIIKEMTKRALKEAVEMAAKN